MILHTSPRVVKVDRFDADVRVEGVLVEEIRAARKVGHEEFRVRHTQKPLAE